MTVGGCRVGNRRNPNIYLVCKECAKRACVICRKEVRLQCAARGAAPDTTHSASAIDRTVTATPPNMSTR